MTHANPRIPARRRKLVSNQWTRDKIRQQNRRLFFERLEERSLMALLTWTGGGGDAKWSTAANWQGGAAPQQDDNLNFPFSATSFVSQNDFASGTRFRSVTISSNQYVISEAVPDNDRITLTEGFVYNATNSGAQFNVPITLGASQTFISANIGASIQLGKLELANLQALSLDGRGDFDVEGTVSGSGGITKLGDGTLVLGKDNTFEGIVTVTQGAINLRANNALGSTSAGTIAAAGTSIQLQGGITVGENIAIRDVGQSFEFSTMGAIRSLGAATQATANKLTGTISMINHGSFGVDAGSYLTVTGQILAEPGVNDGGLTKFGAGTLEIGGSGENAVSRAQSPCCKGRSRSTRIAAARRRHWRSTTPS